jgi:phosphatidylinositol-3-phosphatase
MEENTDAAQVAAPGAAPYLQSLLSKGATVTNMDAGYPAECPSLPAYLLVTSGSTHGVCDDKDPDEHPIDGDNIFSRVGTAGREWRVFAESMDEPCRRSNTPDNLYLVRHTAAPYYTRETERCQSWQVPLGTPEAGALKEAVDAGLPAFSLVVPNQCHDMHGGDGCTGDRVAEADRWLEEWLPSVLDGPDYTAGNLLVIITWDESANQDVNHIPTLVLHPDLAGTTVTSGRDHCSTLRTMADWLDTEPLGCAADAEPLVPEPGA